MIVANGCCHGRRARLGLVVEDEPTPPPSMRPAVLVLVLAGAGLLTHIAVQAYDKVRR